MTVKKIHHINFLVKNLDEGIRRYRDLLGLEGFILDELPGRGVVTARVALGEQWLVLVQPLDPDSVPGRHLAEHGEGFFLISYAVDDLPNATNHVQRNGFTMTADEPRQGLEDWQLVDIDIRHTMGVQMQFCQERDG